MAIAGETTMMEEERKKVVVGLIQKSTNSTDAEIHPRLLKAIKSAVRYSDSELRIAAQTLMSLMKRNHSQVRYLTLLIIDELFMRSKLFRTILVENLDLLLSLSVGFRRDHPLPAPDSVAPVLRSKAIEFLEKWNDSFGLQYRQLRLGYEYLKNTLRYQFPNLQANRARIQQQRKERELKTKEILLKKLEKLKANLPSIKEEAQLTIDEIGECLDVLSTNDDDMSIALDDDQMEEFRNTELRDIRLDTLKEGEKIKENNENKVLFDALRELYKVLVIKHLAAIQEWISVLIRVEVEDTKFRDSTLKDLIDIKNTIQSTKRKCEESGCDFSIPAVAEEEEEDIWEDGTSEMFERTSSDPIQSKNNDHASTSASIDNRDSRKTHTLSKGKEKKNKDAKLNPLRNKLLAEAPILNWGSYVHNWETNGDILANRRGLDLESHWGRVDQDAVIPSEKIAELNVRASVYEEDPIEIQPCRAPLRKGGLCQRRDLKSCPFHGPIIERDDEGKPISESPLPQRKDTEEANQKELDKKAKKKEKLSEVCENEDPFLGDRNDMWDDDEMVERLLKQAVKNVRKRDMEEATMKESDKKAMKKAKLAKVREHNDAVLRDAALASTWRSAHIGEDTETGSSSRSSAKSKKQTLAGMLKRKETAKDRLRRRVLNARARDSTIRQLSVAQDTNYREAFPNQW